MLFNSYSFIFIFLPVTLFLFYYVAKFSQHWALIVLLLASLIFYAWHDFSFVYLLLFSILINYIISKNLLKTNHILYQKVLLWCGISFNLVLLTFFKYSNFIIENINAVFYFNLKPLNINFPIGISFFTFTQIAFLVDSYRGLIGNYRLINYALFVTYFPHLIAGPIIHHKEVMPQFENKRIFKFSYRYFLLGLIIFTIGLFKKTVLADYLINFISPIFDEQTSYISLLDAWIGAIAYAFELYFDFSGYSDMAIGLSLLVGIKLPINFYSPYCSVNIIEFWRRWNITLSRFLRDYLYIPLGGNRVSALLHYRNLIITMVIGGIWHGANWTFVIWGSLHAFYLCVNHGWISIKKYFNLNIDGIFFNIISRIITFFSVVLAWVYFRAPNLTTANKLIYAMFFNPVILPDKLPLPNTIRTMLQQLHITFSEDASIFTKKVILLFSLSLLIINFFPNVYQILYRYRPALTGYIQIKMSWIGTWKPTMLWSLFIGILFVLDILFIQSSSAFLYFNF